MLQKLTDKYVKTNIYHAKHYREKLRHTANKHSRCALYLQNFKKVEGGVITDTIAVFKKH